MRNKIIKTLIIILLFLLPYLLFKGKLYIGGDDTRLMYAYPEEFLKNAVFFSWYHFSSLGWNTPVQFWIPFLSVWTLLSYLIKSKIILSYLAFSLPLVLCFVYLQKLMGSLLEGKEEEYFFPVLISTLFFIFSPIIMTNQLFIFLSTIWLMALIPINVFYFINYLKKPRFKYIFISMLFTTFLSFSLFSVPWLFAFVPSLGISFILSCLFFKKEEIFLFVKRGLFFFGIIFLSQAFWIFPFLATYLSISSNSFAAKVFSKGFLDTFTPTVLSTATGNIFYPLLNLFHRQIVFDYKWDLKNVFLSFFDKTLFINFIFPLTLFIAFLGYKKFLKKKEKKLFILILPAFLISLYFFTVNIGPFEQLFLLLGKLPGFAMFRNFYDKFAISYVLLYSFLIMFSLLIISRFSRIFGKIFLILIFIVLLVNLIPLGRIVNAPLWKTNDIYRNINIPNEYLDFMKDIKSKVSSTNNILSIPFGSSIYTVIKDNDSDNIFAGSSPVIVFSGVNDISGHISFNFTKEADTVDDLLIKKDYEEFNKILYNHNINYVFLTRNVPEKVKKSWIFDYRTIKNQDIDFLKSVTKQKILSSSKGNYELYTTKNKNILINSKNTYFQKVNSAKFLIYIKGLKVKQVLNFLDSFHEGWKLYLVKNPSKSFCDQVVDYVSATRECTGKTNFFEKGDIARMWSKDIFNPSHKIVNNFSNEWLIDPEYIKSNYDKSFYTLNKDGSINIEMMLYFRPQSYFYIGMILTLAVFAFIVFYLLKSNLYGNKKINKK